MDRDALKKKASVYPRSVSPTALRGDCIYAGHRDVPGSFLCIGEVQRVYEGRVINPRFTENCVLRPVVCFSVDGQTQHLYNEEKPRR